MPAAWPLEPERLEAACAKRLLKPPAGRSGATAFFSWGAAGSLAPLARVARDSADEVSAKEDGVEAAIARALCEAPAAAQGELRLITCDTAGVLAARVRAQHAARSVAAKDPWDVAGKMVSVFVPNESLRVHTIKMTAWLYIATATSKKREAKTTCKEVMPKLMHTASSLAQVGITSSN